MIQLYIPLSDQSTTLDGLIALFINNWSGAQCNFHFPENDGSIVHDKPLFDIKVPDGKWGTWTLLTTLPSLFVNENDALSCLTVSGLAAVCRHILKNSESESAKSALGFRQNCLQAPAEVSVWTSFCEVQMPRSVEMLFKKQGDQWNDVPSPIVQFEEHLKKPVRMHNVVKRWQQEQPEIRSQLPDIHKLAPLRISHTFAEGPDMTLADLLLYPCVKLIVDLLDFFQQDAHKHFPYVRQWLRNMNQVNSVSKAWKDTIDEDLFSLRFQFQNLMSRSLELRIPKVPNYTLYRKDPTRNQIPRVTSCDVDSIVNLFQSKLLYPEEPFLDPHLSHQLQIDKDVSDEYVASVPWNSLPTAAHPKFGLVPGSRIERKIQQLDNVAQAVIAIVNEGDVIVDFCSGGGHLGIVLAYLLPKCTLILIDNKEESIRHARERVRQLDLKNITLIQSNLDYYQGHFHLGVALHACGVATDLVLQLCLSRKASFVLCPCCYGNLALDVPIMYPQSQIFRDRSILSHHFSILCRVADHVTAVGRTCMTAVDLDRVMKAIEQGYQVTLTKLRPKSCTPKHNLLIGRSIHKSG